jgi:hypothetical protein
MPIYVPADGTPIFKDQSLFSPSRHHLLEPWPYTYSFTMPVTVKPFGRGSSPIHRPNFQGNEADLLEGACPEEASRNKSTIQTSFSGLSSNSHVLGSPNGFVYAALLAYKHHYHLIIRPEDVWFSILAQLNFYVEKHAEELRSFFVSHQAKKDLLIQTAEGDIRKVNFGQMATQMSDLIGENVNDPELHALDHSRLHYHHRHRQSRCRVPDDGCHAVVLRLHLCIAALRYSGRHAAGHKGRLAED